MFSLYDIAGYVMVKIRCCFQCIVYLAKFLYNDAPMKAWAYTVI